MSKRFYPRPMRCVIVVHPYPLDPGGPSFVEAIRFPLERKNMRRRLTFLSRPAQRRVTLNKKQEQNMRQRSIHHRDPSYHVESTDRHHPAR